MKEEIIILVYILMMLLEIVKKRMELKHQRSINWINNKLFISNKMDVILQHPSMNTINENKRKIISTNSTENYSDDPSTTDSDSNNNSN